MCRLRGFHCTTDSGLAEPPRILITAVDANEGGTFLKVKKKKKQMKSDDSSSKIAPGLIEISSPG